MEPKPLIMGLGQIQMQTPFRAENVVKSTVSVSESGAGVHENRVGDVDLSEERK